MYDFLRSGTGYGLLGQDTPATAMTGLLSPQSMMMGGAAQAMAPLMGPQSRPVSMGQVLAAAGAGAMQGQYAAKQLQRQETADHRQVMSDRLQQVELLTKLGKLEERDKLLASIPEHLRPYAALGIEGPLTEYMKGQQQGVYYEDGTRGGQAGGGDAGSVAPVTSVPLPAPTPSGSTVPSYSSFVTGRENSTGNPAARNPNSTAMGDGQFIESTWLDLMKRNRPDLVKGKTDADILSMRSDPKLSREMIDTYGLENRDFLQGAGVKNVGPAEQYLAHFLGPDGAAKALTGDPTMPLGAYMSPKGREGNARLAPVRVGDFLAELRQKAGGAAPAQETPAPAATTPTPAQSAPSPIFARKRDGTYVTEGMPAGYAQAKDESGRIYAAPIPTSGPLPRKPEDIFKVESGWRQEFKDPLKNIMEITTQTGIIRNAVNKADGTGDIAAIIAFNKLLDPGAVVREADVTLTLAAQGVADRLQTWMNNKKEGDILPPDLRRRMLDLSEQIHSTSSDVIRDRVMSYRDAVEAEGGNWDRVITPAMVERFGWQPKPDPNRWQKVEIPAALTPQGKNPQGAAASEVPVGKMTKEEILSQLGM
ncbi:hypothetical protein GGE65_007736 [Skermanella aerolata]|uniref:hypothetical protein n=1 Tax=Skermanella aerolata TaxID=393310 RepID=UPI003D25DB58